MEIGEITKVASRKRMNAEAEQLRDKVAKETAKIIKLKVAQDTAYWDLKEKLHQVESNHERLQQNMVEVQMQHETISGQYQDELRLRPETLNKASGTREICSVLESYSARLKDTLSRCRADHAALLHALQRTAADMRAAHARAERAERTARAHHDTLNLTTEHQNQLLHLFSASKQESDKEISELKSKLESALVRKEELVSTLNEMSRKLDMNRFDIGKKEETINNLQRDIKQLIHEFNIQGSEAKNTLEKQEKDLKASLEANASLREALHNQELLMNGVCEQKSRLEDKMAAIEEQNAIANSKIEEMKKNLEEAAAMYEKNKTDLLALDKERELLKSELKEKEKLITTYEQEIQKNKLQIHTMAADCSKVSEDLKKCLEESNSKIERVEKLTLEIQTLIKKNEEAENSLKIFREKSDEKIKEFQSIIEGQNKELDTKAVTITQLMSELKTSTDIRSKLETALQKVKKEIELEKEKVMEKERLQCNKIEQLEGIVRDKEDELTKQMSIILEMRDEKDRLQEKIQGMQNTIDNIQKELTGRPAVAENRIQPELDDNAVMLTPGQKKSQAPPSPLIQKKSEFLVPRKEPKQLDSMLYTLFSDSSMEGDTLDVSEVNRRFAAMSRGERVSPAPLATLKRRGGVPAAHSTLKYRPAYKEGSVSLSQVKNDMNKERSFFKNKRVDNKTKRNK